MPKPPKDARADRYLEGGEVKALSPRPFRLIQAIVSDTPRLSPTGAFFHNPSTLDHMDLHRSSNQYRRQFVLHLVSHHDQVQGDRDTVTLGKAYSKMGTVYHINLQPDSAGRKTLSKRVISRRRILPDCS